MATFDYDIGHKNAKSLAITIPSTVTTEDSDLNFLVADTSLLKLTDDNSLHAGDKFAEAIYKSNGYYAQLANAFEKIAKHCNTAINNSQINVKGTKDELKQAKKSALSRKTWSTKRKEEAKIKYETTKDLFTLINK